MITIEQAEAAGFMVSEPLAIAEGHHEFAVRWSDAVRAPAATGLEIEVRRTGRVHLTDVESVPDPDSALPPCPAISDSALPEVEVRVMTADLGVVGLFTGLLEVTRSSGVEPRVWRWTVRGDGVQLRGMLPFPSLTDPLWLIASVDVVHFIDGGRDDRGTLAVALWRAVGEPPTSHALTTYRALPIDGCQSIAPAIVLPDGTPCDPRKIPICCWQLLAFEPLDRRDEDAGALP